MFAGILKHHKRDVRVDVVKAIELNRDADYILITDANQLDRKDLATMIREIKKAGIKNVVGFMLTGDPDDAIQTVQSKRRNNATKPTRH